MALNADLSRRRSRVRAPSSPPFLFKVFPAFSSVCRHSPQARPRCYPTSADTKCPQYSGRTVAATVAVCLIARSLRDSWAVVGKPRYSAAQGYQQRAICDPAGTDRGQAGPLPAMRTAGIGKAELARRLNCHLPQVDRLLDLRHASRLDQLEAAFRALGKQLSIEVSTAA